MDNSPPLSRQIQEIGRIAFRHIFLPINAIIFGVVILLVIFGNTQEGLFLGAIVVVNIALGFGQDVRAWITLERLQLLTAFRIIRIENGAEHSVLLQEIRKGDELKIRLGDQVPCDSVVVSENSLEVNEGLITGESNSFAREKGSELLAGSVVTSGSAIIRAQTPFSESAIAKMTAGLKRYSANPSPIQISIQKIITYTVYVLLAAMAFVVVRGILLHEPDIRIVENIGALASVLVPQGLVVAVTLLFTFGASHFYNRHVLLQEVNATEKFGHIKNLCMDKTGTLTENTLTVEQMKVPGGVSETEARKLVAAYVHASDDSSQIMRAIEAFAGKESGGKVLDTVAFSSSRQYGAVCLAYGESNMSVLVGASEVFLPHLENDTEREWLKALTSEYSRAGKHILCTAKTKASGTTKAPRDIAAEKLSIVSVFVLGNKLREGIRDSIDFFQERGVVIRILSGDNAETARAIASAAGIHNTDALVTGAEMEKWDAADYAQNASTYAIFARIRPEQKEKLIEAFKKDGFTAMVGDGANDALALKKSDLGIAMADGSSATRQIAAVVLMGNSFTELPGGVRLADSMIENIEIFASIFMNQTFVSFLLFAALSIAGFDFPLTPLNISFINYFAVGMPGILISYWAIRPLPRTRPVSKAPFLRRVLPLPSTLSVVEAIAAVALFAWAHAQGFAPATLLVITFIISAYFYFALAPRLYQGPLASIQRVQLFVLGVIQLFVLYFAFKIPVVLTFFNIAVPSFSGVEVAVSLAVITGVVMFLGTQFFSSNIKR